MEDVKIKNFICSIHGKIKPIPICPECRLARESAMLERVGDWAAKNAFILKHHGAIDLDLNAVVRLDDLLAYLDSIK